MKQSQPPFLAPSAVLRRRRTAATSPTGQAHAPALLRLGALGQGDLWCGDERLDWYQRPLNRTLLVYLALQPQGVEASQLKYDLWPEATNYDPLTTALHQLRRLVGKERIVNAQGVYRLLPPYQLDATQYAECFYHLEDKDRCLKSPTRIERLRALASRYGGPFLLGTNATDAIWIGYQRHRWAIMQAWICYQLAADRYAAQDLPGCFARLRQAIDADRYFDLGHFEQLRLLDAVGARARAQRYGESYLQRLATRGLTPSPELPALLERWRQQPLRTLPAGQPFTPLRASFSAGAAPTAGDTDTRAPEMPAAPGAPLSDITSITRLTETITDLAQLAATDNRMGPAH